MSLKILNINVMKNDQGGCEWYQLIGLIFLYISPVFFLYFKRTPALYTAQNVFEWVNNSVFNRIEGSDQGCKKHDSGWFAVWIFLDTNSNLFRTFHGHTKHGK